MHAEKAPTCLCLRNSGLCTTQSKSPCSSSSLPRQNQDIELMTLSPELCSSVQSAHGPGCCGDRTGSGRTKPRSGDNLDQPPTILTIFAQILSHQSSLQSSSPRKSAHGAWRWVCSGCVRVLCRLRGHRPSRLKEPSSAQQSSCARRPGQKIQRRPWRNILLFSPHTSGTTISCWMKGRQSTSQLEPRLSTQGQTAAGGAGRD